MTRVSSLASAALCVTAALAVAPPAAAAEAGTTVTSFTLAGGSLSVAQGSGTFTHVAAGTSTALGEVVVHDTRGSTLGWTAYATAAVSAPSATTVVSYGSGPVTTKGSVTATSQGATQLSTVAVPVVVGSEVTGNNWARWTPTVAASPAAEAPARATGTVTHSVL